MPETEHQDQDKNSALFGRYELGKLLGCGAFAKVYHARDLRNGHSVAIKIINKQRIVGNTLMSNIKREISVMRRLHHPHIVKLFEVLATKSKIYFVMEFVKGGELFARVAKGRFSEDLSRKYFQQLISAVGYCHTRGVIHRDLKPENLLLDDNGDLKVSDFGLSAVTGQTRSDGLLHTLCGTPAYVAPDILAKKGYDGAKVDVWSCGIILYVMTAGYLPFNDPNLMAMYKKIYKGEFRCPKWMSADLKRLLSRLLETNPDKRITVDEILRNPWFRKGGFKEKEINFYYEEDKLVSSMEEKSSLSSSVSANLNAFDLISFSSGLDLSGLFQDAASNSVGDAERFVSAESGESIMKKAEAIGREENLKVKKTTKEWGVRLEGQNGGLSIGVETYRLTDDLVVVDVRRRGADAESDYSKQLWSNKLMPELRRFAYRQEGQPQQAT